MKKQIVQTDNAPRAIGPYSQAVSCNGLMFVSGQGSIEPKTQEVKLFDGDFAKQTRLTLENLSAIAQSQGLNLSHVLKVNIYLTDMARFSEVNEVYAEFFNNEKPARATVAVSALPAGMNVEIDAIICADA